MENRYTNCGLFIGWDNNTQNKARVWHTTVDEFQWHVLQKKSGHKRAHIRDSIFMAAKLIYGYKNENIGC